MESFLQLNGQNTFIISQRDMAAMLMKLWLRRSANEMCELSEVCRRTFHVSLLDHQQLHQLVFGRETQMFVAFIKRAMGKGLWGLFSLLAFGLLFCFFLNGGGGAQKLQIQTFFVFTYKYINLKNIALAHRRDASLGKAHTPPPPTHTHTHTQE